MKSTCKPLQGTLGPVDDEAGGCVNAQAMICLPREKVGGSAAGLHEGLWSTSKK